jgi:hypothetical protein
MKKLIATSIVTALLFQPAFSQVAFMKEPQFTANQGLVVPRTTCRISGKVQAEEGKKLPFASVLLLSAKDSTLEKGMVANEDGEYYLENVEAGQYLLLASGAGYQNKFTAPFTLAPETEHRQTETIILPTVTHQSEEVKETQKPFFEQQSDKLVVHVQKEMVAASSTALDILACSPGVTIDRHHYSLFLNGQDDIMVMIDGEKSSLSIVALLQKLSSMKSIDVERIELITAPYNSYKAKDKGGVINIVLKPNPAYGTTGSFTFMAGYGAHPKAALSLQLTHHDKKINWFGEYALLREQSKQEFENFRQVDYQQVITQTKDVIKRNPLMISHSANIGLDYYLSSKTSVSGLLSGWSTRWNVEDEQIHTIVRQSGQVVNEVNIKHQEVNQLYHLMSNLAIRHRFTANQEISLNLDHLYYHTNNPNQFTISNQKLPESSLNQDQFSIYRQTPIRVWVSKADYAKQFNTSTSLGAGLKGSLVGLANMVRKENAPENNRTVDTISSYQIGIREANIASYVNFHHQLNANTQVQTGVRWEFTRTQADTARRDGSVDRHYGIILPHVLLSRNLPKGKSLELSYERLLIRPSLNNLAPFLYMIDPTSGNLSLKPALREAFGMSYHLKENYTLAINYSYEKNSIIPWQVFLFPETNQQYGQAANLKHTQSYLFSFSLPIRVNGWWQMHYQTMGAWQRNALVYEDSLVQLRAVFGSINSTNTFTLPKNFSVELTGNYQTRSLFGIAYMQPSSILSLAVEKKLQYDRGILKLTANNLFGTMGFGLSTNRPNSNWNHSFSGRFNEPRILKLTYSRTIGNKQLKAPKTRVPGPVEECRRASN